MTIIKVKNGTRFIRILLREPSVAERMVKFFLIDYRPGTFLVNKSNH